MKDRAEDAFAAIASLYSLSAPLRIEKEESGMNNTTRMVYAGKERYVLRVYDNHRDRAVAGIEHAILLKLQQADLSFRVPVPIANLAGSTVTEAPDGRLAAIFGYIGGHRPTAGNPAHVEGLGRASGELTNALAGMGSIEGLKPEYTPYYDFQETHAAVDEEALRALLALSPRLEAQSDKIEALLETRSRLTTLIEPIKRLPHQWIHGDIVTANALADGDAIIGLLDFEFCTIDVRAMEMAVVLAEFPCEHDTLALNRMELLCKGYGEKYRLERVEILLLPDLIQLRMMDVWLHFAGRLAERLDPESVWLHQIERASFVCGWVERHRMRLHALFQTMLERQPAV